MTAMIASIALTAALVVLSPAPALADVSVTMSVRSTTVSLNDGFALTISVEGALNVPAPDLGAVEEHFSVRSAGSSTNMSMVNGRITQSKSFTYTLLPRATGTFTVGPARIEHDGAEYLSNSVEVTVVEGGTPAASAEPDVRQGTQPSSGRDVFATTTVDRRTAYVDEQITLSFKYYRRSEPFRQPSYEAPDLTGFWVEDLDAREEYIEVIEGKRYRVTELKTALFGAASGTATVGPATLVYYDEGPAFTFFSRQGERQTLRTDPIELDIRPLPAEGRPSGFSGAVGRYQLSSSIDVDSVVVGDPVTLTVTIRGDGNIRTVPAPDLSGASELRVYESGSSTEITRKNGVVGGVKRYELVLVPETEGDKTIPAIELVFFDPSTGRYETTGSPERTIEVIPGGAEDGATSVARTVVERLGGDIRYIRESDGALRAAGRPLHARIWFLLLQLVPPLGLALVVARRRRSDRLGNDVRLARYRRATARSRDALKAAERAFADGRTTEGCSAVARAVTDFIGDRTGVEARGLTLRELEQTLRDAGADDRLVERVRSLLGTCDAARFAGASDDTVLATLPEEAGDCLRAIETLTRRAPRGPTTGSRVAALVALAVLLTAPATGRAQAPDAPDVGAAGALFREANRLYATERYEDAAEIYESLIADGFTNADVHYNLGNARYKLGEAGRAVLGYERALRLEPGHDDAAANLAFVREQLADRQAPLDDGPVTAFIRRVFAAVHISALEVAASALLFCMFGALTAGVVRRRLAGWPLRVAVGFFVGFALLTVVIGVRVHSTRTSNEAVVLARELSARTGPGSEFVLEFRIHEGTKVSVQETRGEWSRVTLRGTDLVGWVRDDGLERI